MSFARRWLAARHLLRTLLFLCVSACAAETGVAPPTPGSTQPLSPDAYILRLNGLHKVLAQCQQSMTREACAPSRVGANDQIAFATGVRNVEYDWLRSALQGAVDAGSAKDPAKAREPAMDTLREADQRIQREAAPPQAAHALDVSRSRGILNTILSRDEFSRIKQPGVFARMRDSFLQWLSDRLQQVGMSAWSNLMTNLLFIALAVLICSALVWWFARQIMHRGLALVPAPSAHSAAPSARDWELWLDTAHRHAYDAHWREAVHDVYWSAISRLEASGSWPADRARTPREYLNLLASGSQNRVALSLLTHSFERIWYGGKSAREQDYEDACALLAKLASR